MMRIRVIGEGLTEQKFVHTILRPYFDTNGIHDITCSKISHSKGGLSKYAHLKTDIINTIYEQNTIVTTFIDFYALPNTFPNFETAKQVKDKNKQVEVLENAIKESIENDRQHKVDNFIPYIQLHEFEALLFSSVEEIQNNFDLSAKEIADLNQIVQNEKNPELINNGVNTAPSKRLKRIICGYNKVIDGMTILQNIGMETILKKCPRFNRWIQNLVSIAQ